jgi:hypothetical protein
MRLFFAMGMLLIYWSLVRLITWVSDVVCQLQVFLIVHETFYISICKMLLV